MVARTRYLPGLHLRAEEGRLAVAGLVEQKGDVRCSSIVSVLYELIQNAHAIGVQFEYVVQTCSAVRRHMGGRRMGGKCMVVTSASGFSREAHGL